MAEKHDQMLSHYRARLIKRKYKIEHRSPFVDYRPDIFATKGKERLFVEVEIESTLHSDHTLQQLAILYRYARSNRRIFGLLVVPRRSRNEAIFCIESVFGDERIQVDTI